MPAAVDTRRAWRTYQESCLTMVFVIIGVLVILGNLADVGPSAGWTWNLFGDLWKFCVPFAFAVMWWTWADVSGLNKRREMEKMEERKQNRRKENLVSLGLGTRGRRKAGRK